MLVVRGLLQILQVLAIALAFYPALLNLALQHFGFERPLPDTWIRFLAIGEFVGVTVALAVLPGGSRNASRAKSWSKLAGETGGDFSVEKRGVGSLGWSGGPTVQWNSEGVTVTLAQVSQSKGSASTRFTALFTASKSLHLGVLPNNFLTRSLTSPKFVSFIQASVRRTGAVGGEAERESAAREIGVLAGSRVTLGDSRLDEAVLVKSDDVDLARYVLTSSGVSERMNELEAMRKDWTLSLATAEGGAGAQLALEFPGAESRPELLAAAKGLIDALLSSLRQNGILASSGRGFAPDSRSRHASY
jgi:hypothetical protein